MLVDATATKSLWDTTQIKVVLPTILVTAFVTALITEPMKVAIQNRWKQRQIRKQVLAEIAFNTNIVWLIRTGLFISIHAPHETPVKDPVGGDVTFILTRTNIQSSNIYNLEENIKRLQRTAYEAALKDFYQFYRLPEYERLNRFYEYMDRALREFTTYFTERYELSDHSLVWLTNEVVYSFGTSIINASFKSRSIAWNVGPKEFRVLITPKPIRVYVGNFFVKHWQGIVVAWWKRVLEDYKRDYEDIKKQSSGA